MTEKKPYIPPRPTDHSITESEEREFDACVAHLRAHPEEYINAPALLRMAEFFESDQYRMVQERSRRACQAWDAKYGDLRRYTD